MTEIPELEALNAKLAKAINQAATSTTQEDKNKFIKEAQVLKLTLSQKIAEYKSKLDPWELKLRQDIAQEYDLSYVGAFSPEGWAVTRKRSNDEYNYINPKGQLLGNDFTRAYPFHDAWGRVFIDGIGYKYINSQGEYLKSNNDFQSAFDFSEGIALVKENYARNYYFINSNNQTPPSKAVEISIFYQAFSFSEELAFVEPFFGTGFSCVDKNLDIQFLLAEDDYPCDFSQGLALCETKNTYYFLDKAGKKKLGPFDNAYSFSCNLAAVLRDGKWQYIDRSGQVIIENKLKIGPIDEVSSFSQNLAVVNLWAPKHSVSLNGYMDCLINTSGEIVHNLDKKGLYASGVEEEGRRPNFDENIFTEGVLACKPLEYSCKPLEYSVERNKVWIDKEARIIFSESKDVKIDKL